MKETIIAVKGFDANWKCRGFQYELGKTYTHDGEVEICASGFHACEYPLDCFGYYDPATSKYAVVEMTGPVVRHDDDTKIASASIAINAELRIPELVSRAVKWILDRVDSTAKADEEHGHVTNTGNWTVDEEPARLSRS